MAEYWTWCICRRGPYQFEQQKPALNFFLTERKAIFQFAGKNDTSKSQSLPIEGLRMFTSVPVSPSKGSITNPRKLTAQLLCLLSTAWAVMQKSSFASNSALKSHAVEKVKLESKQCKNKCHFCHSGISVQWVFSGNPNFYTDQCGNTSGSSC